MPTYRVHAHHTGTRTGYSQDIDAATAADALHILRPVLCAVHTVPESALTFSVEEV